MSLYGVIGYHVTLSEGHMIAKHPISYYIRGDRSPLNCTQAKTQYTNST